MPRYLAFISYRHTKQDTEVARLLRTGLENYHLPKNDVLSGRRRVFRDTDELPTSADLGKDIENALEDSGYLIAVCSEEYVKSRWCMSEISYFIRSGRKERILPVLVSGDEETSVPESIRDIPVICDLRNAKYRSAADAVPILLSVMSGLDEHRIRGAQSRFRLKTAGIIFAVIIALILGFSFYALSTANRINTLNTQIEDAIPQVEEAEQTALKERDTALLRQAQYISKQAWQEIADEHYDEAIGMALSVLPEDLHGEMPVSRDALAVLRAALSLTVRLPYTVGWSIAPEPGIDTALAHDSEYVVVKTQDGGFYSVCYKDGKMEPYEGIYNWVSILDTTNEILKQAKQDGYTEMAAQYIGTPRSYAFYGNGLPMKCVQEYPDDEFFFTLSEETFPAEQAINSGSVLVAWYHSAGNNVTALFNIEEEEARSRLDLSGCPLSVTFGDSDSFHDIILCTDQDELAVIDSSKGSIQKSSRGSYKKVMYFYLDSPRFFAIAEDGTASLLDAFTFDTYYQITAPSPIRKLVPCRDKQYLLALYEDGVRIYDLKTGSFVMEVCSGETPDDAFWTDEDGNTIAVFYKDRVDFYIPDTKVDTEKTDYIPLYNEAVTSAGDPQYSPDGKSIYLTGTGILSKWDTRTGELLWINDGEWGPYYGMLFDSQLTSDGSGIWRATYSEAGVERIDTETGKTLFSRDYLTEHADLRKAPKESPDHRKALLVTDVYSHLLIMIDAFTGEELWRCDSVGISNYKFSTDSSKLYCIRETMDEQTEEAVYLYDLVIINAESGEEIAVYPLSQGGYLTACLIPEQNCAVVVKEQTDPESDGCRIQILDIDTGELTADFDFEESGSASAEAGNGADLVLSWTIKNEDQETVVYCAALAKDGTLGERVEKDSEEGRSMTVSAADTLVIYGEEAYLSDNAIWSMRDGTLLLGSVRSVLGGLNGSYMNFSVAPDGSSVCVYNQGIVKESIPFLILSSDTDTLVRKAKARLEAAGGDTDE